MFRPIILTLIIAMLTATTAAAAQQLPIPPAQPESTIAYWPDDLATTGESIEIVTLAAPSKRNHCTVATFSSGQITCSRHFHRAPTVYRQQEILAVVEPGHRGKFDRDAAVCALIAGGVITGAVFLGILVSMPLGLFLAIPTGLFGAAVAGLCGLMYEEDDTPGYTPASVLFLRSGHQLAFPLQ
jgi:hypothetical protein